GSAGLPIFQGGASGLAYALGPTGGYLMAWIPAAVIVGAAAAPSGRVLALQMAGASLLILATGTFWLAAPPHLSLPAAAPPALPGGGGQAPRALAGARALPAAGPPRPGWGGPPRAGPPPPLHGGGVAQRARAAASKAGGRGFHPPRRYHRFPRSVARSCLA